MAAYQVTICPICARRRRVVRLPTPRPGWRQHRCSQGHVWDVEMGTLERILEVQREILLQPIRDVFTAPNPFFTRLPR